MKKIAAIIIMLCSLTAFSQDSDEQRTQNFPRVGLKVNMLPDKHNTWVFILAGQSNMAGRGRVEPQDTVPEGRILTINNSGELIVAKEPLHFYEPSLTGLDCGLSFGKALLEGIPPGSQY